MFWAVTGKTAAELIESRSDPETPNMRLTSTMEKWSDKLDAFLEIYEQELLTHAEKVKAEVAKKLAEERYETFDKKRKIEAAKQTDEEDIKELEEYLKRYGQ